MAWWATLFHNACCGLQVGSRTAYNGSSSSMCFGRGANNCSQQKNILLRNVTLGLGLGGPLWTRK